ncbi:MAG: hypothetical protein CMM54_01870 [Rhodospirillaceae bacterium]|nr:hypothetical protein [Rhodospirillaceae bacterium]|tara:strand:+ start:1069 stop:1443 length:375 start_codon:yes stop_codon:yes gene_type:complete
MDKNYDDIANALWTYFDGLYEGDTLKLSGVFHPECHLFSSAGGEFLDWPRDKWFEVVNSRESPKSQGLSRFDRIVSIDMSDETTALAKVNCAIPPRYFTDYLTLLKLEGKWQIVSKSFRFDSHD